MNRPEVVRVERRRITRLGRGRGRTVTRYYVVLRFGRHMRKLAVSKDVARWIKSDDKRTLADVAIGGLVAYAYGKG